VGNDVYYNISFWNWDWCSCWGKYEFILGYFSYILWSSAEAYIRLAWIFLSDLAWRIIHLTVTFSSIGWILAGVCNPWIGKSAYRWVNVLLLWSLDMTTTCNLLDSTPSLFIEIGNHPCISRAIAFQSLMCWRLLTAWCLAQGSNLELFWYVVVAHLQLFWAVCLEPPCTGIHCSTLRLIHTMGLLLSELIHQSTLLT
jgi:hypothetical protein